jgi:hypothetical protein
MENKEIISYFHYPLTNLIIINDRIISALNLSSHLDKHIKEGSITRKDVIKLTLFLNRGYFPLNDISEEGKMYYEASLFFNERRYKLV